MMERHPCYSADAQHQFAHMHLPVAPACNIQCNYCSRKYDCVNESRPGVTSEVQSPEQALNKVHTVMKKLPNLAVLGIAGPGDALANWHKTRETLRLIGQDFPEMLFCLSTNGLALPEYAAEIVALNIHHVTVTVNAVDPVVGAKIYKYITIDGVSLTGVDAVAHLIRNQLTGIRMLVERGVKVKVNIVMIAGVNADHIPEVVRTVKELGAAITNIMPLIPAPGSVFEDFEQTSHKDVTTMRNHCAAILPQMRHCQQCRADAIGLLHQDRSAEFRDTASTACASSCEKSAAAAAIYPVQSSFRIAVTSRSERLVDQHFGHARSFLIYETDGNKENLVERRNAGQYCTGNDLCDEEELAKQAVVDKLADCAAVVSLRAGSHAKERLKAKGILAVEVCSSIAEGLALAVDRLIEQERIKKQAC